MKLKKGTLLFLLLAGLAYTTLAQTSHTLQYEDITINNDGFITACSCTFSTNTNGTNLTIPKSVTKPIDGGGVETITIRGIADTFPIGIFENKNLVSLKFSVGSEMTTIGQWAFENNPITTLSLPEGLTTIGQFAFYDNDIATLSLPPTLTTIGGSAFRDNRITTLTFPDDSQLTTIEGWAFQDNLIGTLSLPPSLTTIGGSAFRDNRITTLTFPDDSQLERIGDYAFQGNEDAGGNQITTLTLPASLTTIGESAFEKNNITTLSLPASLTTIGEKAFFDNSLTTATFNNDPNKSKIKNIEKDAFSNNTGLAGITLPEHAGGSEIKYKDSNQEYSPGATFTNFERTLTTVIPAYTLTADDVEMDVDGKGIITNCKCGNFLSNSIIIPEKIGDVTITGIGEKAFREKNLIAVAFANESKVTSIGNEAFYENNIATLTLPTTLTTIVNYAFYQNKIATLDLPTTLTTIGERAFWKNIITELSLPENLTTIGVFAFSENEITELSLPPSLTTIGNGAFKNNQLTTVTFVGDQNNKSMIRSIGIEAFRDNSTLAPITLPSNGNNNFGGYKDSNGGEYSEGGQITDFTLGYNAFIPYTLTAEDIDVDSDGIITLCHCDKVTSRDISIPASITKDGSIVNIVGIGGYVFTGKQLSSVLLHEGLISIGREAFSQTPLTSLTLPRSVKHIGVKAFYQSKLASVTFDGDNTNKANIISIGHQAFGIISGLTSINLPSHVQGDDNFRYKDSDGNEYVEGAEFTEFQHSLYADIPYILTADDIEVDADGVITKCNCDKFDSRTITIPTTITKSGSDVTITGIENDVFAYKYLATLSFSDNSEIAAIGNRAFQYNMITTLTLPTALTTIGQWAFFFNQITELTLPTTLTAIGNNAFQDNQIETLSLPTTLTTIGTYAFAINPSLDFFTLPSVTIEGYRTYWQDGNSENLIANPTIPKTDFGKSFELVSIQQFTLTTEVAGQQGGTITRSVEPNNDKGEYDIDTRVTITANPQDGWRFDKWVIGQGDILTNTHTITLQDNIQVTAHFVEIVTLSVTIQGVGQVQGLNAGGNPIDKGQEFTIVALPNAGHKFVKWVFEGQDASTSTSTYTIPADKTQDNVTIEVHFEEITYINPLNLTIDIQGQGTTTPNLGMNTYEKDSEVELEATPADGWRFDKWVIGTEEITKNPTSLTLDTDKSTTAHFVELVTLTIVVREGVGNATVSTDPEAFGNNQYDKGASITLSATPNIGWKVDRWVNVDTQETFFEDEITIVLEENTEIGLFLVEAITLTVEVNDKEGGTVTPDNPSFSFNIGESSAQELTAEPNPGWRFDKWVITGENNKKEKTTTITLDQDKTATAHFVQLVTLTTSVEGQQGGTIAPLIDPNGKVYDINTEVTLTATHQDGWRFDKWEISDEEDKTDEITTITLNQDKTATAHFVQLVTLTTSVEGQQGGTIAPLIDPNGKVYDINTEVTLTATHQDGWRFDKWEISDEEDKTDEITTITLNQDKTATAHFVQLVTLTTSVEGQQGGTIFPLIDPNGRVYDINTEVELTANPADGWRFDKWVISDEEDKTDEVTTITLDKNKSVTAHFVGGEEEEAITSIFTEVVSATPYPNPVTSQITLKAKDGDLIQLFSQKGKQQYSTQHAGNEVYTIDVSTLPIGVYLVRITDAEGKTTTKRIVKK